MSMTREEILKYRSDGIPDEITANMQEIMRLAMDLDSVSFEGCKDTVREQLYEQLKHTKNQD